MSDDTNQRIIADYKRKWDAERALADDLADVLTRTIGKCSVTPLDDGRDPRERVLARYREARGL